MSTPRRVWKLDEQSTGQWPDAASGKETLDKEEKDKEGEDKDEEDEDKEDEDKEDEDGGKVFLAVANGELSPLELSRHHGGPAPVIKV